MEGRERYSKGLTLDLGFTRFPVSSLLINKSMSVCLFRNVYTIHFYRKWFEVPFDIG